MATRFLMRFANAGMRAGFAVLAGVLLLVLGYLSGDHARYAVAGAVVLAAIGLAVFDLTMLPVLAFPGMLALVRVGGGSGLTVSDLLLAVGTACALVLVRPGESRALRALLWTCVAYEVALIPTLIQHLYRANVTEWVHEAVLVGGSLIVGWAVGRRDRAHAALSLFVVVCSLLGIAAALRAPFNHFQPVYLEVAPQLVYQKNALGDLLAFAAIVAYARPSWLGWSSRWANTAVACCVVGILATQSKQAMISVAVGVAVIAIRAHQLGRRSRMILYAMIPLVVIAYVVTMNQFQSSNRFNAVHQRLSWYQDSIDVWRLGRWLGVGLRWWYTDTFRVQFQPPNAEFEMLTSGGVVGLAAFLITSLVALAILWRVDPVYGTLAFAALAARLVQGQFDLFWVASQSSIPWLIVGVALGAESAARYRRAGPGPAAAGTSAFGPNRPPRARPEPAAGPGARSGPAARSAPSSTPRSTDPSDPRRRRPAMLP